MVELTVPYESRMKKENYLNLNKELRDGGYKAAVMLDDIGATGL